MAESEAAYKPEPWPMNTPHVVVPDHVADRDGNVWRVVRDGGMLARADYTGAKSCGIEWARLNIGPLRPVYVNGEPDGLGVESA